MNCGHHQKLYGHELRALEGIMRHYWGERGGIIKLCGIMEGDPHAPERGNVCCE